LNVDEIPAHDRSQPSSVMSGDLGRDDLKGTRHDLKFHLTLEGDVLYGAAFVDATCGLWPRW